MLYPLLSCLGCFVAGGVMGVVAMAIVSVGSRYDDDYSEIERE